MIFFQSFVEEEINKTKGQTVWKANYSVLNSPTKQTKNHYPENPEYFLKSKINELKDKKGTQRH